jgi:hypothetical protein
MITQALIWFDLAMFGAFLVRAMFLLTDVSIKLRFPRRIDKR